MILDSKDTLLYQKYGKSCITQPLVIELVNNLKDMSIFQYQGHRDVVALMPKSGVVIYKEFINYKPIGD